MENIKTVNMTYTIEKTGDSSYKGSRAESVGLNIHERLVCIDADMTCYFLTAIQDCVENNGDLEKHMLKHVNALARLIADTSEKAVLHYRKSGCVSTYNGDPTGAPTP
jgi:hypothetical protein